MIGALVIAASPFALVAFGWWLRGGALDLARADGYAQRAREEGR